MRRLLFIPVLVLCACANDVYTLKNGQPIIDQDNYRESLHDCKMDALDWYYHAPETEDARDNAKLVGALGGIGGAIGGGLAGAATDDHHDEMENLITKHVEACMVKKGYLPGKDNKA